MEERGPRTVPELAYFGGSLWSEARRASARSKPDEINDAREVRGAYTSPKTPIGTFESGADLHSSCKSGPSSAPLLFPLEGERAEKCKGSETHRLRIIRPTPPISSNNDLRPYLPIPPQKGSGGLLEPDVEGV